MGGLKKYCCILVLYVAASSCMVAPGPGRMKVAVEGVVYCKVCGSDPNKSFHVVATLAPLEGAVVKLQCNNTNKGPWEEQMETDSAAAFSFQPEKVSSWGAHKCRIFLVSSPRPDCTAPTGNPYFDATPWNSGFTLTKTNTTSTSTILQHYTTARPLLFYSYWPHCI